MSEKFIDEEAELDEEEQHEKLLREDDEDSEEEEEVEGVNLDAYEKDDFIVADDEEEDQRPPVFFDEEQSSLKRKSHPSKKKKKFKRLKRGEQSLSREVDELRREQQEKETAETGEVEDEDDEEVTDDNFIVGGRYVDDDDIFGGEEEDEEFMQETTLDEDREERVVTLKDIFGPDLLRERLMTEEDNKIREDDTPERILLRQGTRSIEHEELYNEACWIYTKAFQSEVEMNISRYRSLSSSDHLFDDVHKVFVETIIKILKFILQSKYDIPYIAQYKKEDFENIFHKDSHGNDRDLWRIFEWDEKWCILQSKKKKLRDLYRSSKSEIDPYYLTTLDLAESIDEVNDLQLHFSAILSEEMDIQIGDFKRPTKRDMYSLAKREGLEALAKQMALTSQHFAENLVSAYQAYQPSDSPLDTTSAAEPFITKTFDTVEKVLTGARHFCAHQILHEPKIRQKVRYLFETRATLHFKLTNKGRASEDPALLALIGNRKGHVQEDQRQYEVSQLSTTDILKTLKFESLGLLKVGITLQDAYFEELFRTSDLYLSQKYSQIATLWNDQRKKIIEEVKQLFNKTMPHSVKNNLRSKGCDLVCDICEFELTEMLLEGPYDDGRYTTFDYDRFLKDKKPRPTRMKVLSCIPGGEEKERTTWVMLDEDGNVLKSLIWPIGHPLKPKNVSYEAEQKLENMKSELLALIQTYKPSVIALGACGGLIFKKIREFLEGEFSKERIPFEIVPDNIARIYENSNRANQEFPDFSPVMKRAVSIGRRLRDPLTEIAGLFNDQEMLCLKFSKTDLQDMVPKDQLIRALEKSLVRVVNRVGVEINRILEQPQLQSTLRFVSGLGPRKARLLLDKIKTSEDQHLTDRELIGSSYLSEQKNVAVNCVGFLIVRKPPNLTTDIEYNVLDATRVHLLSYPLARKIVADGLDTDTLRLEDIHEIFERSAVLDELDLDTYADELEKRNYGKTHITLKDIKEELKYPFKDPRKPFLSINHDYKKVFEIVTHENDESLHEKQIVLATVVTVEERIAFCKLDNGLFGVVTTDNMNDEGNYFGISLKSLLREGEQKYFVVVEVVYKEFKVRLSRRVSAFKEADPEWDRSPVRSEIIPDSYNMPETRSAPVVKKNRFHRQIDHAAFRDFDYAQARTYLSDKAPGELVIRPSSKGYDHLSITFKFAKDLYINYDIEETQKGKDINSVGSVLKVDNKIFSDLDEVIFHCVENLMEYASQLESSPKYFSGDRDQIKNILREEKKHNPKLIPYRITMSTSKPAKYYIFYLPGRQTIKEKSFTVTPDGYSFNNRTFKDTVKLINAFKISCQAEQRSEW